MRAALCAAMAAALAGCGYVGDPLPPALHIPTRVMDLTAIQRAELIEIRFTAPAQTTEDLGIRQFGSLDLRIGPTTKAFNIDTWSAGAKSISAPLPEPGKPVVVTVPAAEWAGREVVIAARFVNTRGRESEWSNAVTLTPRGALAPPALKAELHPEGVRLSWASGQARIVRGDEPLATAPMPEYIDRTVEVGKTYTYRAQAVDGAVESVLSAPVSITVQDKFPPKPPASVTAVVGLESVELAWEPNAEADVSSYRVYRSAGSDDFSVVADAVQTPAFSDRTATGTGAYRYRVTATDKAGNESAASTVVEVTR